MKQLLKRWFATPVTTAVIVTYTIELSVPYKKNVPLLGYVNKHGKLRISNDFYAGATWIKSFALETNERPLQLELIIGTAGVLMSQPGTLRASIRVNDTEVAVTHQTSNDTIAGHQIPGFMISYELPAAGVPERIII